MTKIQAKATIRRLRAARRAYQCFRCRGVNAHGLPTFFYIVEAL